MIAVPKRRGRPPKVKTVDVTPVIEEPSITVSMQSEQAPEPEPVVEPVKIAARPQIRDAVIEFTLSMPGYDQVTRKLVVKDIVGNLSFPQRTPDAFMQIIKESLMQRVPKVE